MSEVSRRTPFYYGWVIAFSFLISGIAIYGVRFTYGVFFKSLESEFSLSRAATSSILSINLVVSGISAFLMGWALDRYGPKVAMFVMGLLTGLGLVATGFANSLWHLYLTYGVLVAMGIGAVFVVPMATISRWFDRKRGLAAGIASSGIGLGPIILAPLGTYIILNYSWRVAFIVTGFAALIVIIAVSRLLKRSPERHEALPGRNSTLSNEERQDARQQDGLSLSEALRARSFYLILLIYVFFSSSIFFVTTHLVPHVTDAGFSAMDAAAVLSMIGAAAIAGRVLMGIVSDRVGRRFAVALCALLQSAAILSLIWAREYRMIEVFAVVYGVAYSGMSPSLAALIGDTFGVSRLGTILGVLEVGFGLGAAAGPTVGGYIFDVTGSYHAAFVLWSAAMFTAGLIAFLVRREQSQDVSRLLTLTDST